MTQTFAYALWPLRDFSEIVETSQKIYYYYNHHHHHHHLLAGPRTVPVS
jgi:hypothetical protein